MVMKLLPKPRGKVTRKPISGKKSDQRNKFHNNETYPDLHYGKALVYNDFSKKIIQENPGIIKAVNFLSKNVSERRFVDPKNKFEILRVTNFIKSTQVDKPPRGALTNNSFVIKINEGKKELRFFLKEQRGLSIRELILLKSAEKVIQKSGFSIIQPHLAFEKFDPNPELSGSNILAHSYILYDFTNKLTVKDARKLNKLSLKELLDIDQRLVDLQDELHDTHSIPIENLTISNCFIDLSKKPYGLYLFDPIFDAWGNITQSKKEYAVLKKKFVNQ